VNKLLREEYSYQFKSGEQDRNNYNGISVKKKTYFYVYIFLIILIGSLLVLHISHLLQVDSFNYRINNLEQRLNLLKEKNNELQLKVASQSSLSKIEQLAKNKLEMVEAEQFEVLVYANPDKYDKIENKDKNKSADHFILASLYNKLMDRLVNVQAEAPH